MVFAADDDAVGVQEVADGLALAQELGIRRHGHALGARAGFRQHALHEPRRADRDGRLVDDHGVGRQHRGDLPGDRLDEREVGGAVGALGGLDAQENDLGGLGRGRGADDELEPACGEALLDQLGQTELEDGNLALLQARDPLGVDVGAEDVVPEMGEAGRGGEPDVPGPDDGDPHETPNRRVDMRSQSRARGAFSERGPEGQSRNRTTQQPTAGNDVPAWAPDAADPPDDDAALGAVVAAVLGARFDAGRVRPL